MAGALTINSNLAAVSAERRLAENSEKLQTSFQRLSSGLRINRASDDAAGLAISEALKVDVRVFGQGVRNVSDAISVLNISEGALTELSNILIRQRELSQQAANGTLSLTQRRAINEEANALVDEFNRIVESTDFNDLSLLSLSVDSLRIQGGYGIDGSISFDIASKLSRVVGDGTFQDYVAVDSGATDDPQGVITADLNGDGVMDLASIGYGVPTELRVLLGNGDGTFDEDNVVTEGILGGAALGTLRAGDFDGDGVKDIAVADYAGESITVFFGATSGDGTYSFVASAAVETLIPGPYDLAVGDLNGDGIDDIAAAQYNSTSIKVVFGSGDRTLTSGDTLSTVGKSVGFIELADIDGDGDEDIFASGGTGVDVFFANGDGTFQEATPLSVAARDVGFVDINNDGFLDMVGLNGGIVSVSFGNGDGTFEAAISSATGGGSKTDKLELGDFNGDGISDVVVSNYNATGVIVMLGNADGTFGSPTSFDTSANARRTALGDFDGDGVLDIAAAAGDIEILLANTTNVTTIGRLNLNTRDEALEAMEIIEAGLTRVNSELGAIGSVQSRLSTAVSTLRQSQENYESAKSRIVDADVAFEAAELVKNQILQQSAAAVLSQANQAPEMALKLLE